MLCVHFDFVAYRLLFFYPTMQVTLKVFEKAIAKVSKHFLCFTLKNQKQNTDFDTRTRASHYNPLPQQCKSGAEKEKGSLAPRKRDLCNRWQVVNDDESALESNA